MVLLNLICCCCCCCYVDQFRAPDRPIDKPFRFCVADVYKGKKISTSIEISLWCQ